ncbi:MAG: hypothetical protein JXB88_04990 [Spirochaetales bacterium]|nr:hypothetical protein [Spirochaetales bacterium]
MAYVDITWNLNETEITILFDHCKQSEWAEQADFDKSDVNYIQFRNADYPGKNFGFALEISDLQFIPE